MTFGSTEEIIKFNKVWNEVTNFVKESAKKRGVNLANYIIVVECGEREERKGVKMDSVIQKERSCLVCKTTYDIHKHHVFFGTANRKKSDQYGLVVYLCGRHHNMSNAGVHFNKTLDNKIKQLAQRKFEETHSREEFMREFGRNWL